MRHVADKGDMAFALAAALILLVISVGLDLWLFFRKSVRLQQAQQEFLNLKSHLEGAVKLGSLGEMASGLAHEINNPLAIIFAKASLTRRALESGRELKEQQLIEVFIKIESTVERITKIIKGIQTMARQSDHDPFLKSSVKTILEDTIEICQFRLNYKQIPIHIAKVDPRDFIDCRPYQVVQILVNLINNSYDAIVRSGKKYDNPWIRVDVEYVNESNGHRMVEISVTDCGPGLNKELLVHLMKPFFTTKPAGQGTGLGLSISKEIAEQHQGSLSYDSNSNNTRFVLRLPQSQAGQDSGQQAAA